MQGPVERDSEKNEWQLCQCGGRGGGEGRIRGGGRKGGGEKEGSRGTSCLFTLGRSLEKGVVEPQYGTQEGD